MKAYPVSLDLTHCKVLVVGGGTVAHRKVCGVLDGGGCPDLIAPDLCPPLRALVEREGLCWKASRFAPGDTAGYTLVFAATDRREINAAVAREATTSGSLVNVVDMPGEGSFIVPAVLREGEVVVSLSTGGASPLFARVLRDRLRGVITPAIGRTAARLAELREEVHARWPGDETRRRSVWSSLITSEFLDAAAEGCDRDVEFRIAQCLSQS